MPYIIYSNRKMDTFSINTGVSVSILPKFGANTAGYVKDVSFSGLAWKFESWLQNIARR